MSELLSNISSISGNKGASKRVGRGVGSGKGWHTSSRGSKGQKSRSGGKSKLWFEGGQTPLIKRMPYMRGFVNHNSRDVYSLNLTEIVALAGSSKSVNPGILVEKGVLKENPRFVKILSRGEISEKIDFEGFEYSAKAKEKIEKAGGNAK